MRIFGELKVVYAHCDIPCGIYSAVPSAMAAETVEKMVILLTGLTPPTSFNKGEMLVYENSAARMVRVKEEHAELCKKEILILWTDYFKPEHLIQFPDLHEKIWVATKLCSKNKREINLESAKELRQKVAEIGEIFERTKK
ncbi:MAG: superoxide dismutase, Ni [Candidatus Colwellbacteria bacterium]|nr:superoxide dismutase, Ni [Candidatus Colwellbacteria bacterium]